MKFCFKIGVPSYEALYQWGDYYFAKSFGDELIRQGHEYVIHILPEWDSEDTRNYNVVIHFRGLSKYKVNLKDFNVMWNISHPEAVTMREYEKYDIILVASQKYTEMLKKKVSVPVYTLLQFVDTNIFYEEKHDKEELAISFVGNTRGIFRESVKYMIELGYEPAVFGEGWNQFIDQRYIIANWVENDRLKTIYSKSKILLNDHWEDMKAYNFINNRIFDAAACGTIIVNDYVEELTELFEEAIVYQSEDELHQLMLDISTNYSKYKEKARVLQNQIIKQHTVKHRVIQFLDILEHYPQHIKYKSLKQIIKIMSRFIIGNKKIVDYLYNQKFRNKSQYNQYMHSIKERKNKIMHQKNAENRGGNIGNLPNNVSEDKRFKNKKIAFLITEYEEVTNAGDKFSALGIGLLLRKKYHTTTSYYVKVPKCEWYNVDEEVDYIICMTPEINLKILKRNKAKVIAWIRGNTDNWIRLNNLNKFDGIITSSNQLKRQLGAEVRSNKLIGVVNLGIPIDIQKQIQPKYIRYDNREIDICFIGNIYDGYRSIVRNLEISSDIRFEFYGQLGNENHIWKKYHKGSVIHKKVKDIYLNTKIVIEDIAENNKGTVNLRIFEAAACGALVICNEESALFELFEEEEIIVYKSKQDLNDKIRFYLNNGQERIRMAQKLSKKVWERYTFDREADLFNSYIEKLEGK